MNTPAVQVMPAKTSPSVPWLLSAKGELVSALVAGGLLLVGVVLTYAVASSAGRACFWVSLAIGLFHGGRAAVASLGERKFDIDVLMVVAAVLAAVLGAPGEGALLLFLFVLSGALEDLAMQRTTRAIEALHALMPTAALKLVDGAFVETPPEALVPGDEIKILPGERIPTDAEVVDGSSSIDQATLTGESMPRSVTVGDQVFAGTLNIGNPVRARVTRAVSESSLQKILDLVTTAQAQREPVQRLIDRVNQPYAIGVMLVSIAVFLVWWLAWGDTPREAMRTAITLLIVMSPCAVIIATPTATLAGIARAARGGVLFKGGQAIERLAALAAVAFDKTGTLTVGKPRVRALEPIGWSDEERLLAVAASLEHDSTHPIADAVRREADARGLSLPVSTSPTFTPGRGVSAMIEGREARVGTLVHTLELIPQCLRARVQEVLSGVQQRGAIGTTVAWNDMAGVIILADTVRPGAETLVRRLHELAVRPVVMLTGDNRATAHAVATGLGLDRYQAECLPADKLIAVEALKEELRRDAQSKARPAGGAVGVIGDGVNDAPALAAADVSIAIGSIGSDAALESADIVLLADDLSVVPWALALARRVRRTIRINLALALSAIVVMAVVTLVGSRIGHDLPLWVGVLTHEGGTLVVVANSLLILGARGVSVAVKSSKPANSETDRASQLAPV
jgi:Zn2+/Cd2+-exporting ATPase